MNEIEKFLITKNIRPTAIRILVFKLLATKDIAISLSDVELEFEKSERTTLYRTLKTFEEKGIVHRVNDGTGVAKFALCEAGCNCEIGTDLHFHFHCNSCGETHCLPDRKIPVANLPKGYLATDANLVFKGLCNKCNPN
jgi:Fur family transcriptional regulator, ferric uptake regulator